MFIELLYGFDFGKFVAYNYFLFHIFEPQQLNLNLESYFLQSLYYNVYMMIKNIYSMIYITYPV